MGKGKFCIFILTALLVCILCMGLWAVGTDIPGEYSLGAVVSVGETREELACWYDDYSGTAYFFIPGYASPEQVFLQVSQEGMYEINGIPVENGMSCGDFRLGEVYPLTTGGGADLRAESIAFVQSGGVSTLFLDVQTGSMDYIHEDKAHKEPGRLRLYDEGGVLSYEGSVQSVNGRGQTSWNEAKKSYNMTLEREADLLELGSARNWVLQANAKDPSHLRNKLVFDFAEAVGLACSPDSGFVDLYLNGEYAGLYLLCEKIEIHPQRVDISESGSFLMVKDGDWRFTAQGEAFVQTREKTALGIRYADMPEARLQSIWQSVENAIMSRDGVDSVTGKTWQELIDLESWVKKHLIEEVFGNQDAMMLSQYFYMDGSDPEGKIYSGPVWDYDLAMMGEVNLLYAIRPGNYGTLWPPALYEKEEYYNRLVEIYGTQFRPLLQQLLDSGLETCADQIHPAAQMNALRWYASDALAGSREIMEYMRQRVALLDRMWLEEEDFVMLQVQEPGGAESYFALEKGTTLEHLPTYRDSQSIRYFGWHDSVTGEPVDLAAPLAEDKSIFMKYELLPRPENREEEETEPLRKTQLAGAAGFGVMLVLLMAAEIVRQRKERPVN